MKSVVVLGAGRIGRCIATLLSRDGGVGVTLADKEPAALVGTGDGVATRTVEVEDGPALMSLLSGADAVVSACQFAQNKQIARVALDAGVSYFDLTEDVGTTLAVRGLAEKARPGQVFVPQCGLAPGYVGILGASMACQFEQLDTLKLRVGALPEVPSNRMLYNLTWSTEGLINEYCNPCDAIKQGHKTRVMALEGVENFVLDGVTFEAFNTSGGLGSLCETLDGKVRELTYKTIRYPGHRQLMDFLINGLRLGEEGERRELLKRIIEDAVPVTDQDVVLILVTATGYVGGKLIQRSEHHRVSHGSAFDGDWSAIQITTASSVCVLVDLFLQGTLKGRGFIAQEEVPYQDFMASSFAEPYRQTATLWTPGDQ